MPDPEETVSEWSDKFMILPDDSPEPGKYRTSRTPYAKEVMDQLSAAWAATMIVVCGAIQVLKTQVGINWMFYNIHRRPGTMLFVQATTEQVEKTSTQRLEKSALAMADSVPVIAETFTPKSRSKRTTIRLKEFPGGAIYMMGAQSGNNIRSTPAPFLLLDEVDKFPFDVEDEGNPITLAVGRTQNYGARAKIYMASTPLIQSTSFIWRYFLGGDQRYYWMPCPFRKKGERKPHFIKFDFENLKWDRKKKTYDDVHYECPHCKGHIIEPLHKTAMLAGGEWRASNDKGRYPSYHISGMYAPFGWLSWPAMAEQWDDAQGKPNDEKAFRNTKLALPWTDAVAAPDWEVLYSRRCNYNRGTVPAGIFRLGAGIDIGANHIVVYVWGAGRKRKTALIDWMFIVGPYNDPKTWKDVRPFLERTYPMEQFPGVELKAEMTLVDYGKWPDFVRPWVREQGTAAIQGVLGRDYPNEPHTIVKDGYSYDHKFDGGKKKRGGGGAPAILANVWHLKQEFYGNLSKARPEQGEELPYGFVMLPENVDEGVCRELVGEEFTQSVRRGRIKKEWRPVSGTRHEALDCRNYARAALSLLGFDRWKEPEFDRFEADYAARVEQIKSDALSAAAAERAPTKGKRVGDRPTISGEGDVKVVSSPRSVRRPVRKVRAEEDPDEGVQIRSAGNVPSFPMPKYEGFSVDGEED